MDDLRIPIGLFFAIVGIILIAVNFQFRRARSDDADVTSICIQGSVCWYLGM